jgi:Fe-S cluster assembly protein SufD
VAGDLFSSTHPAVYARILSLYERAPNQERAIDAITDSSTVVCYITHDTTLTLDNVHCDPSVQKLVIVVERGCRLECYDNRHDTAALMSVGITQVDILLFDDAVCTYTQAFDLVKGTALEQATRIFVASNAECTMRLLFAFHSSIQYTLLLFMLGQGSQATVRGTYIGTADHSIALDTKQFHYAPQATSSIVLKGIATEYASIIYDGLIYIAPGASGSDASLENGTLALSPTCTLKSIPTLEILNNDVRCAHASASGQVDEAALFYLRSRGLSLSRAKTALILSYIVQDDYFKENIIKKVNALSFL